MYLHYSDLLCMYISYGDGHNVEVAGYLRGKLVVEYESYSESVINSMLS